jgi:glutathione S-transferase
MKLYYDPVTTNCRKVAAGFGLMNLPFEEARVDYLGGGHKAKEYLEINPNGCLPTLVDDGFTLWESNAILQYVADKHGAFAYYPKELRLRADINRWHLWESAHWFPSCYVYLIENLVKPFMKIESDQSAVEREAPNWHKLAGILEQRLRNQRWLCGESVSLADISVAAPIHLHPYQKLPLDKYPSVRRWMVDEVEQLPCWKKTDVATMLGLKQS